MVEIGYNGGGAPVTCTFYNIMDWVRGLKVTANLTGVLDSVNAYMKVIGGMVGKKAKAMILDTSANYNLLTNGCSPEISLPSVNPGWVSFPYTTKPSVSNGVSYIIAIWSEYYLGEASVCRKALSGEKEYLDYLVYNDCPSTTSWWKIRDDYYYYMYAEISAVEVPVKKVVGDGLTCVTAMKKAILDVVGLPNLGIK